MTNIPLALRLIACGLDMPRNEPSKTFGGVPFIAIPAVKTKLLVGMNWRSPRGLLYTVAATDDGPRLLPDTSDPLLIGFLLAECRKRWPYIGTWYAPSHPGWMAGLGGRRWHAETELEALTAAWEAAKAAE